MKATMKAADKIHKSSSFLLKFLKVISCDLPMGGLQKWFLLSLTLLCTSQQLVAAVPYNVELTQFSAGTGARFYGSASSATGRDVVQIGDHNGDGFNDYAVTSSDRDFVALIVMKRNTLNSDMKIIDAVSGQFLRVIKGPADSLFGGSIGGVGDINGDSLDDVIIGCAKGEVTGRGTKAGFAVVIFGKVGPFTDVIVTADWPSTSVGFSILSPASNAAFTRVARNARGIGDVNGDGVNDFAVSGSQYSVPGKLSSGMVWIIWGKKSGIYNTIDCLSTNFGNNGIRYTGAGEGDYLGSAVMPAGDFNGDGIADFLMGASTCTFVQGGSTRNNAGCAYLIFGSKTALATMDMSTFVTGSKGVRFLGAAKTNGFGYSLGGVRDVNGDGLDDIAIGALTADTPGRTDSGIVYVIFGTKKAYTANVDLLNFVASAKGFAIYGSAPSMFLCTVAPAGDVNSDGVNDILVGGGYGAKALVHIVYGQVAVRAAHVDTAVDDVMTFRFEGAVLGSGLDGGEDLNGDGYPDILLGGREATVTPEGNTTAITKAGAAWMIPGPFVFPTPTTSPTAAPTEHTSPAPTAQPSMVSTLSPSATSTTAPSATPTTEATAVPTQTPSIVTSAPPSTQETQASRAPSVLPSAVPSLGPSAAPSVAPMTTPTLSPGLAPTGAPAGAATSAPSAGPSMEPSAGPIVAPTAAPLIGPTTSPTPLPTVQLTSLPTATTSAAPSARPTVPAAKNFQLEVKVEQDVFFVSVEDYEAQKAACNSTIQNTIAGATDGVVPERVMDITLEEDEEEGEKEKGSMEALATGAARLKYKIIVYDPVLTVDKIRAQLVQAAQEGKLDRDLRYYATQFGAINLVNGTFGEPQVTSAAVQRDASEQLTGVQIALAVIGVVGGLIFVFVSVLFPAYLWRRQFNPTLDNIQQLELVM